MIIDVCWQIVRERVMQRKILILMLLCLMVLSFSLTALAQDTTTDTDTTSDETTETIDDTARVTTTILDNSLSSDSTVWFIEDEPSIVMNGFDLSPLTLPSPVLVSAVTISVQTPVPDIPIDVLLYADDNGGSPQDATLIGYKSTVINTPGVARIEFDEPIVITSPVIWAGFYLPVDFRFFADTSGSSVLTYWAWQPQGKFDFVDLNNAPVFGPGDGSDPVGLDMGGVARITVEIFDPAADPDVLQRVAPIGVQVAGPANANLSTLIPYPFCGEILRDPDDIVVSGNNTFDLSCRTDIPQDGPGLIRNLNDAESGIASFNRHGRLYDITGVGNFLRPGGLNTELIVPVTHCLTPDVAYIENAVLAIAYGAPQQWDILPTARYGALICAEVPHVGLLTYFTPRGGDESTINANLYFTGSPVVNRINSEPNYDDPRTLCGETSELRFNFRNNGFEFTPATTIRVQDYHVRTGQLVQEFSIPVPAVGPGETITMKYEFRATDQFVGEVHRYQLTLDPSNGISELNEGDNIQVLSYFLELGLDGTCRTP